MANGLQIPNGKQTFSDANGVPLAGGSVAFYIPNTTTPKSTFQDEGLTTPNTNPVTLDAAGRAVIWGSGLYRQIVKDSLGNLIWDQTVGSLTGPDDVLAIPTAIQDASYIFGVDQGVANAYAITVSPTVLSYVTGQTFLFQAAHSSTGPSTLNVDGLGAINIEGADNVPVGAGDILAGSIYAVTYNGGQFQLLGSSSSSASSPGFINRLFNGAINIDQRHAGSTAALSTSPTYGPDRWKAVVAAGSATIQQSNGGPGANGFPNCVVYAVSVGAGVSAASVSTLEQDVEGTFIYDANFGTGSANPVALLFWVESWNPGILAGAIQNSAQNRSFPFSFPVAGLGWESHTIAVPGDTTGTWLKNTGIGLRVIFDMGSGSNFEGVANTWQTGNFTRVAGALTPAGTSGASVAFSGVQLQIGSTTTSFENRPDDIELLHCQRYYEKSYDLTSVPGAVTNNGCVAALAVTSGTNGFVTSASFKTRKRTTPTVVLYSPATGTAGGWRNASTGTDIPMTLFVAAGQTGITPANSGGTISAGNGLYGHYTADAEF